MRYLYLVIAALSAAAFTALQIPGHRIGIRFLSSFIELPVNSLAILSFLLGGVAGIFLALSISLLIRARGKNMQALGAHPQVGA